MGYSFGVNSSIQLQSCHLDLQKILEGAISISPIDFGIAQGHRPVEIQQEYYAIGRTKELHRKPITNIDGVNKVGKHNKTPSEAADIYIYHPVKKTRLKIAYDNVHLAYVQGIIHAVAQKLYNHAEITHLIRWGGNWDGDGIIMFDQSFQDLPHIELVKP